MSWERRITQTKIEQLGVILGREILRWMGDDDSFAIDYWHISSSPAIDRCQLASPPINNYGWDVYYLFRIYRESEELWSRSLHPGVMISEDQFKNYRRKCDSAATEIKNLGLLSRIERVLG